MASSRPSLRPDPGPPHGQGTPRPHAWTGRPVAAASEAGFKELDASSYDPVADAYGVHIERLAAPLAEHLCGLAGLHDGDVVLDVGCGTGVATRRAAALGAGALGVDLSHGMVATARAIGGDGVDYELMDAEALDLADGSFDAVISLCAVAHFPDIHSAAAEMARVLRPGGRLAVAFGHPRPASVAGVAVRAAARLRRGRLVAPAALRTLVCERLPAGEEEVLTGWALQRPLARLREALAAAGFEGLERSWRGHEVRFASPEEFWDAQVAIVTEARRRLLAAPADTVEELRAEFVERARGATLVYPYQAVFLAGRKKLHA